MKRNRYVLAAIGAAAGLTVALTVAVVVHDPGQNEEAEQVDLDGAYVPVETAAGEPNVGRRATPRPDVLEQAELSQRCVSTVRPLRQLIDQLPSGGLMDDDDAQRYNSAVASMNDVCDPDDVEAFTSVELLPWLNYAVE